MVPTPSVPVPAMASHLICVALTPTRRHSLWLDGRDAGNGAAPTGSTRVVPAGATGRVEIDASNRGDGEFEFVHFYISPDTFASSTLALDVRSAAAASLVRPSAGAVDPFMAALGRALADTIGSATTPLDRLLADQIALTAVVHVARRYAALELPPVTSGGLQRRQIRKVLERIEDDLDAPLSLAVLASDAGLSERHFCTTFGRSVGMSPHRYLLHRRIERAKSLLSSSDTSILEVALECGFSGAARFAATFKRISGFTPSAWRRGSN